MSGASKVAKEDGRTLTLDELVELSGHQAPILLNGVRLLDDARVLRKQRRYASATALAVLSIEEVGKFVMTHPHFASNVAAIKVRGRNAKLDHRSKQWAAAHVLRGFMGVDEVDALVNLAGYELAIVEKNAVRDPSPSIEEAISTIEAADLENLIANADFGEHLRFPVQLLQGQYDDVKKKCFYVDIDSQGGITSSPNQIDRDACDSTMRMASKAISAIKLSLRHYRRLRANAR